jgi:UDPglucose 6-dehydrogenase
MKITVVGTGYVGLVAGTCFANKGHRVTCIDKREDIISRLNDGIVPIYEPKLTELVIDNKRKGRLKFSTDLPAAVSSTEVVFICVGTPPDQQGRADLTAVCKVAEAIGKAISGWTIVVTKSTVPVGTADKVRGIIESVTKEDFEVVSNPEFLKEGDAIKDFNRPDRIVIGTRSDKAARLMERLYKPFVVNDMPILVMDNRSAEFTKYAANCMLATKISFINEMANLAERVGVDIKQVRRGIRSDARIGPHFLYPGAGYGGSCFPKDVEALVQTGRDAEYELRIMNAVQEVNQDQKKVLFTKVEQRFGRDLTGQSFAIWGLAFKPGTDDMREAPSEVLIESLVKAGATVRAYDPKASARARSEFEKYGDSVEIMDSSEECLEGCEALLLVTQWDEFRVPNFQKVKEKLAQAIIIDGRNMFSPKRMEELGFEYYGIGRGKSIRIVH